MSPRESKDHTAAGGHDRGGCKKHADQGKSTQTVRRSQKSMFGRSYMSRQMAPALLLVAFLRICKRGPADDLITSSMLPATKSRTIRKMVPVTVPMPTQPIIILGPTTGALGISVMVSATALDPQGPPTNYLQSYVQHHPWRY